MEQWSVNVPGRSLSGARFSLVADHFRPVNHVNQTLEDAQSEETKIIVLSVALVSSNF